MPFSNAANRSSAGSRGRLRVGGSSSPVRADWQSGGSVGTASRRRALARFRRRLVLGLLGLAFLGSAAALVFYLILLPAQTPLVAAVAWDYRWPLPPNAWAREDLEGLEHALGGENLVVSPVALRGPSSLQELERHLEVAAGRARRNGLVIVYLNAHGALDETGQPCLLLPETDPRDCSTWFRLTDLLAQLESHRQRYGCRHLLILDTARFASNWQIGRWDDGFAAQLEARLGQVAALTVLSSTSPGELSWTSPRLRGSAFGYWLRRGLAGEADADGDGRVGLRELARYLEQRVDGWSQRHRASRQVPRLIPSDAADWKLAWSQNPRAVRRMGLADARSPLPTASLSSRQLVDLWERHDQLSELQPGHFAPFRWHSWRQEMLWLEQAATAGAAYRPVVERLHQRLSQELNSLVDQTLLASGPEARAPVRKTAILAADPMLINSQLTRVPSALAAYLGLPLSATDTVSPLARFVERDQLDRRWSDPQRVSQVVALNERGAQLAVPRALAPTAADPRAQRLVRTLLESTDHQRRVVEDRLFQGAESEVEFAEQVVAVQRQYGEWEQRQTKLAAAYQLRDQVWSSLPHLAIWASGLLSEPPAAADAAVATDAHVSEQVQVLSDLNQQLDRVLQRLEQAGLPQSKRSEMWAAVDAVSAETGEQWQLLQAQLDHTARRLALASPATPRRLRELSQLLATPLISAELRAPLYEGYRETLHQLDLTATESEVPVRPVELLPIGWPSATLARALLGEEVALAPADTSLPPGEWGAAMRRALRQPPPSAPQPIHSGDAEPSELSEPGAEPGALPAPAAAVEHDRRWRRLVGLLGPGMRDPFQTLRRWSLQELLLWQARQTLDDFWASTDPDEPPYFARTARVLLDEVTRLGTPTPQIAAETQRLNELMERRQTAALAGLIPVSTDLLLIDPATELTAQLGARRTAQTRDLPPGSATAYLRDVEGPVLASIRPVPLAQVVTPEEGDRWSAAVPLQGNDLVDRGPGLQAVVAFRGHTFATPVSLHRLSGPRIETVRHPYGPSRITLTGADPRTASIVFILDCSYSMRDEVALEAPDVGQRPGRATRMHVATHALIRLLTEFGERADARIGVRFFGHRIGWRTDQPDTLARHSHDPEAIPPGLLPYADIELVLPLGRFDSVVAGQVISRLETVEAWGETPLYLALRQTLQDFGPTDATRDRRVVVITDGENYQFNPPPEFAPSVEEIQQAYAEEGVRIEILGFDIPPDERVRAVREFQQLADATGGSFHTANHAAALVRQLERQLATTPFRVLQGENVLAEAELGSTIRLDPVPEAILEIGTAREMTRLEGGEHLRLTFRRDRERIVALPYEEGAPHFAELVDPLAAKPTGYHLGAHRPHREGDTLLFPLSFQALDGKLTPRPDHVWVEIVPLGHDRAASHGERYVFFDTFFEPDLPAPVWYCRCPDWPREATQAEVRAWILPELPESGERTLLKEIADQLPRTSEGFPVPQAAEVHYQVRTIPPATPDDPLRIRVVQRHPAGTPLHSLKLDLIPRPVRYQRQFDFSQGVVLHDFSYGSGPPPLETIHLHWRTRDELTREAWQLERPLRLNIFPRDEVLMTPR